MDQKALWQRFSQWYRFYPEIGLRLDISRMRFDDAFITALTPKLKAALAEMGELEAGAIANPDEQRMVGHYWLRTPELAPNTELRSAITFTLDRIEAFARDIHTGSIAPERQAHFEQLLIIGIGGSALGPQLTADALGSRGDKMQVHFCDNTDPDGIARLISRLSPVLDRTLVITISKSGGTPETRNGAVEFARAYAAQGLKFAEHAVAVTCEGSKLDLQASSERWIARFPMWDWVGGRTSLFSAVGLLPLALQGAPIRLFLEGASVMDELTRNSDPLQNPAALLAASWYFAGEGRGKKDMVILPYKDRLTLFSKYLQQLVMESLGKERDRAGTVVNQGIAVYGNKGSTDQHAYVQQLREGLNNFFATFINVLNDVTGDVEDRAPHEIEPGITAGDYLTGFLLGTRRALYENGRDSISITIEQLDARTLGAMIALYERTVGLYASLINTNAYHQPGVEAGKKAAASVLTLQQQVVAALKQGGAPANATDLAKLIGAEGEAETVFLVLEHLASNPGRGVVREGQPLPLEARYRMG